MKLHNHEEAGPPCAHMEPMLHKTADGSANWLTRAYATAHAARCPRCGAFLHNLEVGLAKLREGRERESSEDAMARLEDRLAAAAREASPPA